MEDTADRANKISTRYMNGLVYGPNALLATAVYCAAHKIFAQNAKENKAEVIQSAQNTIASLEKARLENKSDTVQAVASSTTYLLPNKEGYATVADSFSNTTYGKLIAVQQQTIADKQKPADSVETSLNIGVPAVLAIAAVAVGLTICLRTQKFIANLSEILTESFHRPKANAPKKETGSTLYF